MRIALIGLSLAVGASGCVVRQTVVGPLDGGSVDSGPDDAASLDSGPAFAQVGEAALDGRPVAISSIPGGSMPDAVAVLYQVIDRGAPAAKLDVFELDSGNRVATVLYQGQTPRALIGYNYELGTGVGGGSRGVLAIVTSSPVGELILHLRDWRPQTEDLDPHNGLSDDSIQETCFNWMCGSQSACEDPSDCGNGEECTNRWACGGSQPCTQKRCILKNGGLPGVCGAPSPAPPADCGCRLRIEFGTEVSLAVADIDGDRKNDLVVATSSDLPVVQYLSSESGANASGPGNALYRPQGCTCGRYAQAPSSLAVLNFGGTLEGTPESAASRSVDLVIGAPGGAFVKYADRWPSGDVNLSCSQPSRIGDLVPVRDVVVGRFACNPNHSTSCDAYEDLVVVSARSLGGGSFDDPGIIRVIYGSNVDLSLVDDLENRSQALIPSRFAGHLDPTDPMTAQIRDFDNDGNDDVGVLYAGGSDPGIHFWFGSGQGDLQAADRGVVLQPPGSTSCRPHQRWAAPDIDADDRPEVAVLCNTETATPTLRWFKQQL